MSEIIDVEWSLVRVERRILPCKFHHIINGIGLYVLSFYFFGEFAQWLVYAIIF